MRVAAGVTMHVPPGIVGSDKRPTRQRDVDTLAARFGVVCGEFGRDQRRGQGVQQGHCQAEC
jgi:hypothetical protein